MQMSHFSLPGTRTSRSHHEADSTADGKKGYLNRESKKSLHIETMVRLCV